MKWPSSTLLIPKFGLLTITFSVSLHIVKSINYRCVGNFERDSCKVRLWSNLVFVRLCSENVLGTSTFIIYWKWRAIWPLHLSINHSYWHLSNSRTSRTKLSTWVKSVRTVNFHTFSWTNMEVIFKNQKL